MATTAEIIAALSALGMIDDAPTAAPVVTRAASPFAGAVAVSGPAADTRPEPLRGLSMADTRQTARVLAIPGWSCTVAVTYRLQDGTTVEGAAHGFATPHKAGDPCPGIAGLARGTACAGVIR